MKCDKKQLSRHRKLGAERDRQLTKSENRSKGIEEKPEKDRLLI